MAFGVGGVSDCCAKCLRRAASSVRRGGPGRNPASGQVGARAAPATALRNECRHPSRQVRPRSAGAARAGSVATGPTGDATEPNVAKSAVNAEVRPQTGCESCWRVGAVRSCAGEWTIRPPDWPLRTAVIRCINSIMPDWLQKPESIFSLVLFVFGTAISLLAPEIKEAIRVPPRRYRSLQLSYYRRHLASLIALHDDSFALTAYLAKEVTTFVISAAALFITAGLLSALGQGLKLLNPSVFQPLYILYLSVPATFGLLFGRSYFIYQLLEDLEHFDNSTAYYRREIERLASFLPSARKDASARSE
jgi:hypothetical protein